MLASPLSLSLSLSLPLSLSMHYLIMNIIRISIGHPSFVCMGLHSFFSGRRMEALTLGYGGFSVTAKPKS